MISIESTNIIHIIKEELYSKEINNQDSKTTIQIKGQILKPPHRSNSFVVKKLKANQFRHCKRLQDSFRSETNPNLPSAKPANRSRREFTDQLQNPAPKGGYVSTSLVEHPFPCRQTFRGEEASYKLRPLNRFVPNQ